LKTVDRRYGPELVSDSGAATKWIVEDLAGVAVQRAPVWIGVACPDKASDPRLWAASNDSGAVFQREADPSVPLEQLRIPRTPRLRVEVAPAE
jgi:hypothetical protein